MNASEREEAIQGLAKALLDRARLVEGNALIEWTRLLPERQSYWRNLAEAAYEYAASQRVHVVSQALFEIVWRIQSVDYEGNFDKDLEEIARIAIKASDSICNSRTSPLLPRNEIT